MVRFMKVFPKEMKYYVLTFIGLVFILSITITVNILTGDFGVAIAFTGILCTCIIMLTLLAILKRKNERGIIIE